MANFYWNIGSSQGQLVTMDLTIIGEVRDLIVTGTGTVPTMPVTLPIPLTFQPCIQYEVVEFGPLSPSLLPLTARGTDCALGSIVQSPLSPSPGDLGGPGPFCEVLPPVPPIGFTTVGGGGGGGGAPPTPQDKCFAAQHSPLLDSARNLFTTACGMYRTDQALAALYGGLAFAAWQVAAGLASGAAAAGITWVGLGFAIAASVVTCIAAVFAALAGHAVANFSADLGLMDLAQTLWHNAIASVKMACCPAWISISTADLTCP